MIQIDQIPEGVLNEDEPPGRSDIASSESSKHQDAQTDETTEDAQASAAQSLVDQKVEVKKRLSAISGTAQKS